MDTKQFKDLRAQSELTQNDVARSLGVSVRTVAAWEKEIEPARDLSIADASMIRSIFRDIVLSKPLESISETAFNLIPSESVTLWLVQRDECIALPAGSRSHDLERNVKFDVPDPIFISPMGVDSLTSYPLKSGEVLNLVGDAIADHPKKKYAGCRASKHLQSGQSESLLFVPGFVESTRGPLPIVLICWENKLDGQARVIVPGQKDCEVYTDADESEARKLVKSAVAELEAHMRLLDMIDP